MPKKSDPPCVACPAIDTAPTPPHQRHPRLVPQVQHEPPHRPHDLRLHPDLQARVLIEHPAVAHAELAQAGGPPAQGRLVADQAVRGGGGGGGGVRGATGGSAV